MVYNRHGEAGSKTLIQKTVDRKSGGGLKGRRIDIVVDIV